RRSDLVGVAKQDSHRSPDALEAFRIEALYDARGHHEDCFHSGNAEIVLAVSERGRDRWLAEEEFGVGARELKLFLRRADPVVRMGIAEPQKTVKIHTRTSLDEG